MWFDTPKISTGISLLAPAQYNIHNLPPQKVDCLCSIHSVSIRVPYSERAKVRDLVSAFGECKVAEQDISPHYVELTTMFYDSRDALKAVTLLPKIAECREYVVHPVDRELRALQIALPQEITKEELWYEISKFGDIAWSNCERIAGKFIVSYLLFDIRCNSQLTSTPLMLNGHCLHVSETSVPHSLVCRFSKDGGGTSPCSTTTGGTFNGLGSPIMASSSLHSTTDRNTNGSSIYSPPILPVESRKPSYFNILASPPNTESNEGTPPLEDFPYKKTHRPTDMPGQLTPPLQECRTFAPAITPPTEKKRTSSPVTPMTPATPATPQSSNKSNKVDLNLIGCGSESRTTVMLRNIPNKVNLAALRRFLDETNKNTYDFLYLRMDFNNKCNVGYAFINFTHPDHIATLTKARRGKKWTQYNSVKIIDVSFANIQGRSALIEKFRDSPIMNMDPEYRPKLYHTSGKLAGQEEAFP